MLKKTFAKYGFSLASVLFAAAYPTIFIYCANAGEAQFSEIVIPLCAFCAVGTITFFLLLWITKTIDLAAIVTVLFVLIATHFSYIEKIVVSILPQLRYWHCVIIVLFLLMNIGWVLAHKLPRELLEIISRVVGIGFGVLILINMATAMPTIIQKVQAQNEDIQQGEALVGTMDTTYKPNIYYIILDEYSGFNTVKNVLGYDNDSFFEYLKRLGFTVSRDSYNDAIMTSVVTANLMNLEYRASADETSSEEISELRKTGRLFKLLKENGYSLQGIGSCSSYYGLERMDSEATELLAQTINGETIENILMMRTIWYPFYNGKQTNFSAAQKDILKSFAYICDGSNFPNEGMFTLMHINSPHQPFIFDKNGNDVSAKNYENWEDLRYYLGQYEYITKLTKDVVDSIIERDPASVIILQSDHSARAASDANLFMNLIPYEDMKNILNAVYYGGEAMEEIQGQSGVNTLRLICNRLFDADLGLLEVPNG